MDEVILSYLKQVQDYHDQRAIVDGYYRDAFYHIGRSRYLGIKLESDRFNPDRPTIRVKHNTQEDESDESDLVKAMDEMHLAGMVMESCDGKKPISMIETFPSQQLKTTEANWRKAIAASLELATIYVDLQRMAKEIAEQRENK